MSAVDVLGWFDREIDSAKSLSADAYYVQQCVRLHEVRAAVAELIEADKEYDAAQQACRNAHRGYTAGSLVGDRLHAADIRRRAALARVHPMTREQQAEQAGSRG